MTTPAIAHEINDLMDDLLDHLDRVAELAHRIRAITDDPEGGADARPADG